MLIYQRKQLLFMRILGIDPGLQTIGFGVIVFTVLITGIYVRRANGEFDTLTKEILKDASK